MPHPRFRPTVMALTLSLAVSALAATAFAGAAAVGKGLTADPAEAQQADTRIGVDADSSGNSDTSLGTIDECVVIAEGETQIVDVFVEDVTDLLAWEAVLSFHPEVIQVADADVQLFMAANEGSDVQDISGELPDSDGRYWLQAFDAADPPAPDSGTGVLARVTVKGVGPGVSELDLPLSDLDGDDSPDEGPLLRDVDVNSIGDDNDDALFDGDVAAARIAVDAACSDPLGPAGQASAEEDDGDGIGVETVLALVIGAFASVTVGGLAIAWAVRRRPSPRE